MIASAYNFKINMNINQNQNLEIFKNELPFNDTEDWSSDPLFADNTVTDSIKQKENRDAFIDELPFTDTVDWSLEPLLDESNLNSLLEDLPFADLDDIGGIESAIDTNNKMQTESHDRMIYCQKIEQIRRDNFQNDLPFPDTVHIDTMYDVVRNLPGYPYSETERNAAFYLDKSDHVFNKKLKKLEDITDLEEARKLYFQVRIEIDYLLNNYCDDNHGYKERDRLSQYQTKIDQLLNDFYGWTNTSDRSAGWSGLNTDGSLKLANLEPVTSDFNGYGITNNLWHSKQPVRYWLSHSVNHEQISNNSYPDEKIWNNFPIERVREYEHMLNENTILDTYDWDSPYPYPSEYARYNDLNSQFYQDIDRILSGSSRFQSQCVAENLDNNFAGEFNKILSFIKIELEDLSVLLKNKLCTTVNLVIENLNSIDITWFVLLMDKLHTTLKPIIECINSIDFAPFDNMDTFVILSTILRALVMAYFTSSHWFSVKFILFIASYNVRYVILFLFSYIVRYVNFKSKSPYKKRIRKHIQYKKLLYKYKNYIV